MGKPFFEGKDLLSHPVTAIIDQDVDARDLLAKRAEDAAILLVAKVNRESVLTEPFAEGVDADAVDDGLGAEIVWSRMRP